MPRVRACRTRLVSVAGAMCCRLATSPIGPAGVPRSPAQSRTDSARPVAEGPNVRHTRLVTRSEAVCPGTKVPVRVAPKLEPVRMELVEEK